MVRAGKRTSPEASRLRILCSEQSHFSIEKAAIQLGLGTQSVVRVPTDDRFRMDSGELMRTIAKLRKEGLEPIAVVATAGTTDFGSFDPLDEIGPVAREQETLVSRGRRVRGALLLSDRNRHRLAGLESADSVTIDFHKAFFQPISCGVVLLADIDHFSYIRLHADYLNGSEREAAGVPDLVTRSVLTTRRFEALKLWVSLQAIGKNKFSAMVDRLGELASFAAGRLRASAEFDVLHEPEFGCVVFRFRCISRAEEERVNRMIPNALFNGGIAVIGHTVVRERACLKLTFCNPVICDSDVERLIESIECCGRTLLSPDRIDSAASESVAR